MRDDALAASMERNLRYVLGELARALPGAELYDGPELFWMLTPVAFRLFNSLTGTRLDQRTSDFEIAAAKERARRKDVEILWWLFPGDTPADLGERLAAAGFRHVKTSPGMALELGDDSPLPVDCAGKDATIATISTDGLAREWCDVLCTTFAFSKQVRDGYLPFAISSAANPAGTIRNYGLWSNGEMVATSTLAFRDGIAGIYNVATLPQAQRRGFGAAVTAHALRDGRQLGASLAVLQSTDAGVNVYHRLGFRERAPVDLFRWPP